MQRSQSWRLLSPFFVALFSFRRARSLFVKGDLPFPRSLGSKRQRSEHLRRDTWGKPGKVLGKS